MPLPSCPKAVEYAAPRMAHLCEDGEEGVREWLDDVWRVKWAGTLGEAVPRLQRGAEDHFENFVYFRDLDLLLGDLAMGCHESMLGVLYEWKYQKQRKTWKDAAEEYVRSGDIIYVSGNPFGGRVIHLGENCMLTAQEKLVFRDWQKRTYR